MWRLKDCPRCHGDMYTEYNTMTRELSEVCLQCAYRRYPLPKVDLDILYHGQVVDTYAALLRRQEADMCCQKV